MNISVIGCGRWGSFIAWYLDSIHHNVSLYGRKTSKNMQEFLETRKNAYLTLNDSIKLETSLEHLNNVDVIVISINSQGLQKLFDELKPLNLKNKIFVLCMKGIEITTLRRLSEICKDNVDVSNKVAVWLGPGHVEDFTKGYPNCMVIDSEDHDLTNLLVKEFSSDLIRFYYGNDLIGNELGAASKNVYGIAAGMLDGLKLTSLKGALMSRGTREVARLIKKMGGNELSAYGLCHLGDYEATVFSKHSHNRGFGEAYVKNEPFDKLAEGYYTTKALKLLSEKYEIELPINDAIYNILYLNKDPKEELKKLFQRSLKNEY